MVQLRTVLQVADNSGARRLRLINVHGGSRRPTGSLGDVVTASVISAQPNAELKKGTMVKAVIVRVKKEVRRADGSYVRFDDNAAVVLEDMENKKPKGTRVFGPIAREVKDAGYAKIASLAPEVL
ncbi:50S ribosomal protein L14 [Candidatus Woesebacteria bacterium]|nr:50S ribosomal protein L14 [Candidatus Woesebacteria bacterium]MCD8526779.1 50S ribosomal protein L14 [Candidatus Woesebacteria bacterium]MCD8546475.1 50S ribosomal protein L14 [Candidatus Woesebacteria bacterium]